MHAEKSSLVLVGVITHVQLDARKDDVRNKAQGNAASLQSSKYEGF